ncbi:MAG: CidA/LrgA family protein [Rickettsiales bacterium]|jgi:holin-like protein|nr:CidA/LrgA family protein [Rickettsiales bacterium]
MIITAFVLAGEGMRAVLPLPIPGSIWGMFLLFLALAARLVKLRHIEDAADFILKVILVLFVVPAVGVMDSFGELAGIWYFVAAIIVITYLSAFASTGYIADFLLKFKGKK